MPTILYEQGFSFSFYAADASEPPHVHVRKERAAAKWWLDPMAEAFSRGFSHADRRKIRRIIRDYQGFLLAEWRRFFSPPEG